MAAALAESGRSLLIAGVLSRPPVHPWGASGYLRGAWPHDVSPIPTSSSTAGQRALTPNGVPAGLAEIREPGRALNQGAAESAQMHLWPARRSQTPSPRSYPTRRHLTRKNIRLQIRGIYEVGQAWKFGTYLAKLSTGFYGYAAVELLDRSPAARRSPARAGLTKPIGPHTLRHAALAA